MSTFKLKMILSILSAIVFSFIFILLAFALPIEKKQAKIIKKHKSKLELVSESAKNR